MQTMTECDAAVGVTPLHAASDLYAAPRSGGDPLRVSLLVPEGIPAWMRVFMQLASENRWIDLSVVAIADSGSTQPRPARPTGLQALMAYERVRGRIDGGSLALVPLPPQSGGFVNAHVVRSATEARHRIEASRPELVLSLASPSWSDTLADGADWGCWCLDASLTDPDTAGMALMTPMLSGAFATSFELELQGHAGAPVILVSSWGATCRTSFLIQRERAYRKLPVLLLRALHRLAAGGLEPARRGAATLRQAGARSQPFRASGLRVLAMTLANTAREQLRRARRPPTWLLMVRRGSSPLDPSAPSLDSSMILHAPAGGFWADPCSVEAPARKLVFVEEMTSASAKGNIACLELVADKAHRLGTVLDEASHLSYPQIFQWQDAWYMTVESSEARRVSLYVASDFPLQWTRLNDLVTDRVCVDPTLHFHEGHWYLFATVSENQNSTWDELFLFVADDLTGPFLPHPSNPILSDVRRARPAGRLFEHAGRLIRPSQDCAAGYGAAVVFNEVLELSPTRYSEQPLSRLAPGWTEACHTYSRSGSMEVLDARGHPPASMPRMAVVGDSVKGRMAAPMVGKSVVHPAGSADVA